MLRSSRTSSPRNSSVSFRMARRSALSKSGNRSRSGDTDSSARNCSHCPPKASTSAPAFSSFSMRRTCAASTRGWRRVPSSAHRRSSASGMLAQRKYDSRAASSCSPIGRAAPATFGSCSMRKRKSGETRMAWIAAPSASSKESPCRRAAEASPTSGAISAGETGRRYARRARSATIRRRHPGPWPPWRWPQT